MSTTEEMDRMEYMTLMRHAGKAEGTAQMCWMASGVTAAVLLSWGIAGKDPGLMLPVLLVVAYGFYARLRGRQQVRLIAGYVEEFLETEATGAMWFTRLGQLQSLPGFHPSGDWLATSMANAAIVAAMALSWLYSGAAPRGELMAGIATGCGVIFAYHSISETTRLRQTGYATLWRQATSDPKELRRTVRVASR